MNASLLLRFALLAGLAAPALPAADSMGQQLGTVRFEVRGSEAARDHVVRGVKLLHHMMYLAADREFAAAIAADPDCALAYWGRAMSIIHPLWPDAPTPAELQRGAELVARGRERAKTPRERDYLAALEPYFRDAPRSEQPPLLQGLDTAWARVAATYPEDLDAAAFSALFHLAPARFQPKDKSHRIQLAAATTIQKILAQIPDHPGAQHYKIHAFDFPLLADRALEICDSYGAIAPDVPHALHMPTHIYTRRGLWAKSIEFNRRSAEAARKLNASTGATNLHFVHALDYLAYAHLQRGEYRAAAAVHEQVQALRGPFDGANRSGMAFAFAAIPARYALERHDWAAAARLEPRQPAGFAWEDGYPHCESITHFARALGAARTGDVAAATRDLAAIERLGAALKAKRAPAYWGSQAQTQSLAVRAWLEFRAGRGDEAVRLLRQAAEIEANTDKEAVTPGEVLPAGELLGDLLLELKRGREALAAYEAMLVSSPNRLNSLHGAAQAAVLAGDPARAAQHYTLILEIAPSADPGVPAVSDAKAFLGRAARQRAE